MSSFVLKIIAIITMLCDHSGDAFVGSISALNVIGRIAFPIFAFQLVVGYHHTSNIKKYMTRLFIFALFSQIPFYIFTRYVMQYNSFILNIFFTLFIGIVTIYLWDHISNKFLKFITVFLCILLAQFINVDYGYWGVLLIWFIHLFCPTISKIEDKKQKIIKFIIFIFGYLALCLIKYALIQSWIELGLMIFTYLPIVFMILYNGKKGPSFKYFFYIFYPAHLFVIDAIFFMLHH